MKESEIRPPDLFNRYLELSRLDTERFFADKANFVEVDCPACGCQEKMPGLKKQNFTYVLCGDCGTLYLSPRPDANQLDAFNCNSEAAKFWSTNFFKETAEARREKMFRPRAQLVNELLDNYQQQSCAEFVDVGSGYGIFLEEVKRLNRFGTVRGVEPNPDLADVCRRAGFPIVQKTVEDVSEGEVQADFATAFEVLEHVFEPLSFLRSVRRLLKPGGLLLFTTLTVSGFDIQVLWENSKSVYPPSHINLISVAGMELLVKRAGLRLIDLSTPGKLDVDIVANMLSENPNLKVPRFVSTLLEERNGVAREEFQSFLSRNRLSSHIRVVTSL
jgi:2-polyprenyl-3-methyl-5-hydroxy-6-metoxy-1,4-benzoquinol methylase